MVVSRSENEGMSFWDHLDELRARLIHIFIAVVVFAIAAFCFKEPLFDIVFAPSKSDFITYGLLRYLSSICGIEEVSSDNLILINTGLTSQFSIHIRVSFMTGLLAVSPYIIYQLFGFISPGLYKSERKLVFLVVTAGFVMFVVGMTVSYFLILPLSVNFLGSYQVSEDVVNMINLDSYIDTFVLLNLMMGVMFELPVVAAVLSKTGLINGTLMSEYRRHAITVILIIAAIITPTTDIFTLLAVSTPVYLLYEISILVVKTTQKKETC